MSQSNYVDDLDARELARWRGQVASATRGRRGQRLLREMLTALDGMESRRLVEHALITEDGEVCALGAVGRVRGLNMDVLDPNESADVAVAFDIAEPLAREVAFLNDDFPFVESPEGRG